MKKKRWKKWWTGLLVVLFIAVCDVQDSEAISDSATIIYSINNSIVEVSYNFTLSTPSVLNLTLERDAFDIALYIDSISSSYKLQQEQMHSTLATNRTGREFYLEYKTKEPLLENEFLTEIKSPFNIPNATVMLILNGVTLKHGVNSARPSLYPIPNAITTNGRSITIKWDTELSKSKGFAILALFSNRTTQNYLAYVLTVLILVSIASATAIIKLKNKGKLLSYLLDEELKILEILKKHKGIVWQTTLVRETGFSKSKITRMLRNLEARNLVEKIPIGNANKVKLK